MGEVSQRGPSGGVSRMRAGVKAEKDGGGLPRRGGERTGALEKGMARKRGWSVQPLRTLSSSALMAGGGSGPGLREAQHSGLTLTGGLWARPCGPEPGSLVVAGGGLCQKIHLG